MSYASTWQRSIDDPAAFWDEQASLINWNTPYSQVLDYSRPPFTRWFIGGTTNLCFNAVDRWTEQRGEQPALIAISSETGTEKIYTFNALRDEIQRAAAMLLELGVVQGDRVLLYMPMIAEATIMMLACARIGAVHSVVFGGFAAGSLASRIDDARPKVVVSTDAGSRAGKRIAYKPLLDEAIGAAQFKPPSVIMVDRGLVPMTAVAGRDHDYAQLRERHMAARVPLTWLESNAPSYILYTSGTTGSPKGIQRDVGGYAVALAASMKQIFCGKPGDVFFSTSDIGWVVGHSYIVYGPLLAGMATVMYEGLPTNPDAGEWWRIVERHRVTQMFSAPTAIRVLKKHSDEFMKKHDLSSLQALFLAGEPLDESTSSWIAQGLGVPVIDNYWQTETGWPILSIARGIENKPTRLGSAGVPMVGYNVKIVDENTGVVCGANEKGVVVIQGPLPPGCMQTVYGDDERFVSTYWSELEGQLVYSTFDWGIRDADGYYFILGRSDDVINVAGHRLGTREIEECISSHPNVAEVAVVGVQDALKGQVAKAFVVLKNVAIDSADDAKARQSDIMALVDRQLGALARPSNVYFVTMLPKTRSGKLLRRAIQALCEGRETGELATLDDPAALQQVRDAIR